MCFYQLSDDLLRIIWPTNLSHASGSGGMTSGIVQLLGEEAHQYLAPCSSPLSQTLSQICAILGQNTAKFL